MLVNHCKESDHDPKASIYWWRLPAVSLYDVLFSERLILLVPGSAPRFGKEVRIRQKPPLPTLPLLALICSCSALPCPLHTHPPHPQPCPEQNLHALPAIHWDSALAGSSWWCSLLTLRSKHDLQHNTHLYLQICTSKASKEDWGVKHSQHINDVHCLSVWVMALTLLLPKQKSCRQ